MVVRLWLFVVEFGVFFSFELREIEQKGIETLSGLYSLSCRLLDGVFFSMNWQVQATEHPDWDMVIAWLVLKDAEQKNAQHSSTC